MEGWCLLPPPPAVPGPVGPPAKAVSSGVCLAHPPLRGPQFPRTSLVVFKQCGRLRLIVPTLPQAGQATWEQEGRGALLSVGVSRRVGTERGAAVPEGTVRAAEAAGTLRREARVGHGSLRGVRAA